MKKPRAEWLAEKNQWKITGKKTCIGCNEEKVVGDFGRGSHGYLQSRCRVCKNTEVRNRRQKNNAAYRDYRRKAALKRYGISDEDYHRMMTEQSGRCAICSREGSWGGRRMSVDHCHKTGRVRALLCSGCNTALGNMGDNLQTLQKSMDYLRKHGATWS